MDYLLNRAKEPTTWAGIIALVTSFGVAIAPDLAEALVATGVAIAGVVAVVLKERGSADAKNE